MRKNTAPFIFTGSELPTTEKDLRSIVSGLKKFKLVRLDSVMPSDDERFNFMLGIAPLLNWKVEFDKPGLVHFTYEENHELSTNAASRDNRNSDDEVVVAWHIEHPQSKYPQIGALWSINHKSCPKTSGSTGFVDMSILYNLLDDGDKEFISKCEVVQVSFFRMTENENIDIHASAKYDGDRPFITLLYPDHQKVIPSYFRKAASVHPLTGENVLRINPKGHYVNGEFWGHDRLVLFDGRIPRPAEHQEFNRIAEWVMNQVYSNAEIQYWHYWNEGDLLLVDVFTMAHCVRGGFTSGQRHLKGIWAFPQVVDLPRDPEQANAFALNQVQIAN